MYSAWLSSILPCSAETSTRPSISTSVRISWCEASRTPSSAEDRARGGVEQPVEREEDEIDDVERIGDPQRHRLGLADGKRLRHLLAEHDVERGEDQEADEEGGEVERRRRACRAASRSGSRSAGDRRLADPAEAERGHGDAELAAGEIGLDVPEHVLGEPARRSGPPRRARRCGSRAILTSANSAATKKALAASRKTARSRLRTVRSSSCRLGPAGSFPRCSP